MRKDKVVNLCNSCRNGTASCECVTAAVGDAYGPGCPSIRVIPAGVHMHIQLIIDYDSESRILSLYLGDDSDDDEITPQNAVDLMQEAIRVMQAPGSIHAVMQ